MFTKNRIRLLIALGIILIVGFSNTLLNLRPVSERKKNNQEKVDYKKELESAESSIKILSESIKQDRSDSKLVLKRAQLYKSINKFEEAIVDYENFIKYSNDQELLTIAKKELKSCKTVKSHFDKLK